MMDMTISTEDLKLNTPETIDLFDRFGKDHDRFLFPGPICRVTGGHGGESILIIGKEKTALLDCGMAYAGPITVDNIRRVLTEYERGLDYIMLSHSHYDHMGALPFICEAFPDAHVLASAHCARVLEREGAKALISELGETARALYDPDSRLEIPTEPMPVHRVIGDGEMISLGGDAGNELIIETFETPGHTNCSMSFYVRPLGLMFSSESTGILEGEDYVHTPCLKSFIQALDSAEKCRGINPVSLCLPHFGMVPDGFAEEFWGLFEDECRSKTEFVSDMKKEGLDEEQMLARYVKRYWTPFKEAEQPKEAFEINSGHILKTLLREHEELKKRWKIT